MDACKEWLIEHPDCTIEDYEEWYAGLISYRED